MRQPRRGSLSRWVVGLLVLGTLASRAGMAFADPVDDDVRRVARQLQCPVCEGQTVADSTSGLANDMRAVIRARLEAGASDERILADFVQSYGESILSEPPKQGAALAVWLGPPIAILAGAVVLATLLVRWSRPLPAGSRPLAPEAGPRDAAIQEYERYRDHHGA